VAAKPCFECLDAQVTIGEVPPLQADVSHATISCEASVVPVRGSPGIAPQ
jgi:hypothetical protein